MPPIINSLSILVQDFQFLIAALLSLLPLKKYDSNIFHI